MKSDSYKYFHPDSILKDLYVVRERAAEIPKKIIKEHTYDLIPPLTRYRQYQGSRTNRYDWPIKTA